MRWPDKTIAIAPALVAPIIEDVMTKYFQTVGGHLGRCINGAECIVEEAAKKGPHKLYIAFAIIPRFFEYIQMLKCIDLKKETEFLDNLLPELEKEFRKVMEKQMEREKREEEERQKKEAKEREDVLARAASEVAKNLAQSVMEFAAEEIAMRDASIQVRDILRAVVESVVKKLVSDQRIQLEYEAAKQRRLEEEKRQEVVPDEAEGTERTDRSSDEETPLDIIRMEEQDTAQRYKLTPEEEEELKVRCNDLSIDIDAAQRGMLRVILDVPLTQRTDVTTYVIDEE